MKDETSVEARVIMTEPIAQLDTVRAVLYLQQHASAEVVQRLRSTAARIRRLEADKIADVEIKTWAAVNPALEELSDSGPSVSLTVKSFQAWADREGYTLRPAFARRETTSMLSSRPTAKIRVPIMCLAVYEDNDLCCVAPCSDGQRTYSVEQCLAALEAGLIEPFAVQEHIKPNLGDSSEETP